MLTQVAFLGAIVRDQAQEMTPAITDAFDELPRGAVAGPRTIARAKATGPAEGLGLKEGPPLVYLGCDHANPIDS